jgi:hypothetical protein
VEVIYFYGWDMNPIIDPVFEFYSAKTTIIRMYDHDGNLLNSIEEPLRTFVDPGGNLRYTYDYPWSLAADRSGRIYCAMRVYTGFNAIANDGLDQFRVYQRDGYRVKWPDLGLTQYVQAVAVDHNTGAVYIGATEEPDGTCLHKYASDGTPLWSRAMNAGSFQAWTGPTSGNQTVYTTSRIDKIEVQPNGDIVVLGRVWAKQPYVEVVTTNSEFVRRYSSNGDLIYTVKCAARDFSLSDDGELFVCGYPLFIYTYDIDGYRSTNAGGSIVYHNDYIQVGVNSNVGYNFIKFDNSWQFVGGALVPDFGLYGSTDVLYRARWHEGKVFCNGKITFTQKKSLVHVFDDEDLSFIETRNLNPDLPITDQNYYRKSSEQGFALQGFIIDRENGRFYFPGPRAVRPLLDNNNERHRFQSATGISLANVAGIYHFLVLNQQWEPQWQLKNASGSSGVDQLNTAWGDIPTVTRYNLQPLSYDNNQSLGVIHEQYSNIPDFALEGIREDFWNIVFLYNTTKRDFIYIVHDTEIPPLAIPLGLAQPGTLGDRYIIAPALPLPIAVGLPLPIRELRAGLPVIYLLRVTGDSTDLALRLSSLQIRRTLQSTLVTLVSPEYRPETLLDLSARKTAGAELVVMHGVRLPGVPDQLDELLRVPFDSLRWDRGGNRASITLGGRAAYAPSSFVHHLDEITYRAAQAGKRRVRCRVNTYLRPGDTALLPGSESLVVGEVNIFAAADRAQMDVAEI